MEVHASRVSQSLFSAYEFKEVNGRKASSRNTLVRGFLSGPPSSTLPPSPYSPLVPPPLSSYILWKLTKKTAMRLPLTALLSSSSSRPSYWLARQWGRVFFVSLVVCIAQCTTRSLLSPDLCSAPSPWGFGSVSSECPLSGYSSSLSHSCPSFSPSLLSPFLPVSAFKLISDSCNDAYIDLSDGISRKNETLTVRLRQGRSLILTKFDEARFTLKPSSFKRQAYQVHSDQPSFCNTRELISYTAYFVFAAPLTDFWNISTPPGSTFPSYAFTWPTGSQRVAIRGGICFELLDDKFPEHNLYIIIRPSAARAHSPLSLLLTSLSVAVASLNIWWN